MADLSALQPLIGKIRSIIHVVVSAKIFKRVNTPSSRRLGIFSQMKISHVTIFASSSSGAD